MTRAFAVTKAVVLAAGRGTRMQRADERARLDSAQAAAADAGAKAMVPVRSRPFLDYLLSSLADAEIREVCLVVAPGPGPIRSHYETAPPARIRVSFAVQQAPLGTADALLAAEAFAGEESFLALNSDNFYPPSAYQALQGLDGPGLPVFERERLLATSNYPRERVDKYAVLEVGADGYLQQIVEKPQTSQTRPATVLLSMNLWRFSPRIFEACRRVPRSSRGELELPQAVQWAITNLGERFRALPCDEGVLDLSTRADIPEVERRLAGVRPSL
jgi:glucose-1-phosphate thymidylyltransferase